LKKKQKGFPLQSGLNKKGMGIWTKASKKEISMDFQYPIKVHFQKILERKAGITSKKKSSKIN
jgi:hypothetical protein